MDFTSGGTGSGDENDSNSERGKRPYHRHSPEQINQLEVFFKECPHPDEKQRRQLGRDLMLEPKQIKFWFQNKRTQMKAQNERADNNTLRAENEKIRYENLAMRDALNNLVCPTCNVKEFGEDGKERNLQKLQVENAFLKREYERLCNTLSPFLGKSVTLLSLRLGSVPSLSEETFFDQGMGFSSFNQEPMERPNMNLISPYQLLPGVQEMEKSLMIETAASSMQELLELLRVNEPIWVKSSTDGRFFLDTEIYNNRYPKTNHFKNTGGWIESSKESGVVPMNALPLFEIFSDPQKWMDVFPNIVTDAKRIATLDTGSLGGSLHLMYAKLHILSPLVEPREYIFLRYCRQLDASTWAVVDTSPDCFKELQYVNSSGSWRLPSGCLIQDMPNENAKVTWIEHVEVGSNSFSDPLFTQLIWSCQAFGAKRWIRTLERMCERFAFPVGPSTMTINGLEGVIDAHGGMKSLRDLSHRMVKNFCEILSTPKKLHFGYLAELSNTGFQVSVRENNGSSQLHGLIVSVSTSFWLPVFYENLFNFFKDGKTRHQWDILSDGSPVSEVAHIVTGTHPGNRISLLRPLVDKENRIVLLQESSIDPLGGLVISAPLDMSTIIGAINGDDLSVIPIPSGFVIASDGHSSGVDGASTSSSVSNSGGSVLTMLFQILICDTTTHVINMDTIKTLRSLISSTIMKIKAAMGVPVN